MAGVPLQVIIQMLGDVKSLVSANTEAIASIKEVSAAQVELIATMGKGTAGATANSGAMIKNAESSSKARAAAQGLLITQKQLATQNTLLAAAWKDGSNIVDKKYLNSIGNLRVAMNRFNEEAKSTIVLGNGMSRSLSDSSLQFERFMLKGNLVTRTLSNMASSMINAGKQAQWTGRQLMVGVTAPILAVGAAAGKMALDVDKADLSIRKLIQGTSSGTQLNDQLGKLDKQSKDLSTSFAVTRLEVKSMQEEFASVGFSASQIEGLTQITTEFEKLTRLEPKSAEELVRVLAQADPKTLSGDFSGLRNTLEKFNLIENTTALNVQDIAGSFADLYPLMRQLNVTAPQTVAVLAAFKQGGIDVSTGVSALKNVLTKSFAALSLEDFNKTGGTARLKFVQDALKMVSEATGKTFSVIDQNTGKMKTGVDLLTQLGVAYGQLQKTDTGKASELIQILTRAIGVGGQSANVAQLFDSIAKGVDPATAAGQDIAKAMSIADDATTKAADVWKKQIATFLGDDSTKAQNQINKLINTAQDFGKKLIPIFTSVLGFINNIIEKVNELSPGMQKLLLGALVGFAAIGPIVYIAAQGIIAFGTVLKGLVAPFKAIFAIKGELVPITTLEALGTVSEKAATGMFFLNEELAKTGDETAYKAGVDKLLTSLKEGTLGTEAMTAATEAQATSSLHAASAMDIQAGSQARLASIQARGRLSNILNFSRTSDDAIASGIASASRPIRSSTGGAVVDREAIKSALVEQRMQNILSGERVISTSSILPKDRRLATRLENRINAAHSTIDMLGDSDSLEASVMGQVESQMGTLSGNKSIQQLRSEQARLKDIQKRMQMFESTFGRAAPISDPELFDVFERKLSENLAAVHTRGGANALLESLKKDAANGDPTGMNSLLAEAATQVQQEQQVRAVGALNAMFADPKKVQQAVEHQLTRESMLAAPSKNMQKFFETEFASGRAISSMSLPVRTPTGARTPKGHIKSAMSDAVRDLRDIRRAQAAGGISAPVTSRTLDNLIGAMLAGPDNPTYNHMSDSIFTELEDGIRAMRDISDPTVPRTEEELENLKAKITSRAKKAYASAQVAASRTKGVRKGARNVAIKGFAADKSTLSAMQTHLFEAYQTQSGQVEEILAGFDDALASDVLSGAERKRIEEARNTLVTHQGILESKLKEINSAIRVNTMPAQRDIKDLLNSAKRIEEVKAGIATDGEFVASRNLEAVNFDQFKVGKGTMLLSGLAPSGPLNAITEAEFVTKGQSTYSGFMRPGLTKANDEMAKNEKALAKLEKSILGGELTNDELQKAEKAKKSLRRKIDNLTTKISKGFPVRKVGEKTKLRIEQILGREITDSEAIHYLAMVHVDRALSAYTRTGTNLPSGDFAGSERLARVLLEGRDTNAVGIGAAPYSEAGMAGSNRQGALAGYIKSSLRVAPQEAEANLEKLSSSKIIDESAGNFFSKVKKNFTPAEVFGGMRSATRGDSILKAFVSDHGLPQELHQLVIDMVWGGKRQGGKSGVQATLKKIMGDDFSHEQLAMVNQIATDIVASIPDASADDIALFRGHVQDALRNVSVLNSRSLKLGATGSQNLTRTKGAVATADNRDRLRALGREAKAEAEKEMAQAAQAASEIGTQLDAVRAQKATVLTTNAKKLAETKAKADIALQAKLNEYGNPNLGLANMFNMMAGGQNPIDTSSYLSADQNVQKNRAAMRRASLAVRKAAKETAALNAERDGLVPFLTQLESLKGTPASKGKVAALKRLLGEPVTGIIDPADSTKMMARARRRAAMISDQIAELDASIAVSSANEARQTERLATAEARTSARPRTFAEGSAMQKEARRIEDMRLEHNRLGKNLEALQAQEAGDIDFFRRYRQVRLGNQGRNLKGLLGLDDVVSKEDVPAMMLKADQEAEKRTNRVFRRRPKISRLQSQMGVLAGDLESALAAHPELREYDELNRSIGNLERQAEIEAGQYNESIDRLTRTKTKSQQQMKRARKRMESAGFLESSAASLTDDVVSDMTTLSRATTVSSVPGRFGKKMDMTKLVGGLSPDMAAAVHEITAYQLRDMEEIEAVIARNVPQMDAKLRKEAAVHAHKIAVYMSSHMAEAEAVFGTGITNEMNQLAEMRANAMINGAGKGISKAKAQERLAMINMLNLMSGGANPLPYPAEVRSRNAPRVGNREDLWDPAILGEGVVPGSRALGALPGSKLEEGFAGMEADLAATDTESGSIRGTGDVHAASAAQRAIDDADAAAGKKASAMRKAEVKIAKLKTEEQHQTSVFGKKRHMLYMQRKAQLQHELDLARRDVADATLELDLLREGLEVQGPDGVTNYSTPKAYHDAVLKRATKGVTDDEVNKLSDQELAQVKRIIAHRKIIEDNELNLIRVANEEEATKRAAANIGNVNTKGRLKSLLIGGRLGGKEILSSEEQAIIAQMHLRDVESKLPVGSYTKKDIAPELHSRATQGAALSSFMTGGRAVATEKEIAATAGEAAAGIAKVDTTFGKMASSFIKNNKLLTGIFPNMSGGLAMALETAGPLVPILAALAIAIGLIATHWSSVKEGITDGFDNIGKAVGKLGEAFKAPLEAIFGFGTDTDRTGKKVDTTWKNVGKMVNGVLNVVAGGIKILAAVLKPIMGIIALFVTVISKIVNAFNALPDPVRNVVTALLALRLALAINAFSGITGKIQTAIGMLKVFKTTTNEAGVATQTLNLQMTLFRGGALAAISVGLMVAANAVQRFADLQRQATTDVNNFSDALAHQYAVSGNSDLSARQKEIDDLTKSYNEQLDAYNKNVAAQGDTGPGGFFAGEGSTIANGLGFDVGTTLADRKANQEALSYQGKAVDELAAKIAKINAEMANEKDIMAQLSKQLGISTQDVLKFAQMNGLDLTLDPATSIQAFTDAWNQAKAATGSPLDPQVDTGGIDQATQDANNLKSALQGELQKMVSGWVDAAMKAFDTYAKSQTDALDAQVKALDDEAKAEEQHQQDLDYLQRKEELRNKRRTESLKHSSDRDLAIYEGRYDDAKQLDIEYQTTLEGLQKDETDLEDSRSKTLTDRKRDTAKEQLNIAKDALQKELDLRKEQLQQQLDAMTEYIPQNVQAAADMHAAIQSKMEEFTQHYGEIGKNQAKEWNTGWDDAFAGAQTKVAKDAFWAGDTAMRGFASGLGIDPNSIPAGNPDQTDGGSHASFQGGGIGGLSDDGSGNHRSYQGGGIGNLHTGGNVGNTSMAPADVPATLQTGEYVIKRSSVAKYGMGMMDSINQGQHPTYHEGGLVGQASSMMSGVLSKAIQDFKDGKASIHGMTADSVKAMLQAKYGQMMPDMGDLGNYTGDELGRFADMAAGVTLGMRQVIASVLAHFPGIYVTSTISGTHAQNSLHYQGRAADLDFGGDHSQDGPVFDFLLPLAQKDVLEELFFDPRGGWKNGISIGPIGGHMDHVHAGIARAFAAGFQKTVVEVATGAPQEMAQKMLSQWGWGPEQWNPLNSLVTGESGWNPTILNPKSDAFGLFQFLPLHFRPGGYLPNGMNSTIAEQITGGFNYIRDRYGDPANAWSWWQRTDPRPYSGHWYHQGGPVFPNIPSLDTGGWITGDGVATVHKGERVLNTSEVSELGGEAHVHLHFEGGYFGSDRELEKLTATMQTKVLPKLNRARGGNNRKYSTIKAGK